MAKIEFYLASSLEKVFSWRRPQEMEQGARLSAWKGTKAAVQLVYHACEVEPKEPMPFFQIMAHRRTEITQTVGLHAEGQGLSSGIFHTKGPIKPLGGGIPELILKLHHIPVDALDPDISPGKVLMDLHTFFLR